MRLLIAFTMAMTVAGSAALLAQGPSLHPAKTYTVCEALNDLKALQGQTVAIRGTTLTGGHGSFLTGTCDAHRVTLGFTWPDIIWLSPPPSAGDYDYPAETRVRKQLARLRPRTTDQIILTYVGVFQAKDLDKSVEVRPNGAVVAFGFGPDSEAPAQLAVMTKMHPAVLRRKD